MVGPAYPALSAFVVEQGYELVGPSRGIYLNDLREVTPQELPTGIEFPVARARRCLGACWR